MTSQVQTNVESDVRTEAEALVAEHGRDALNQALRLLLPAMNGHDVHKLEYRRLVMHAVSGLLEAGQ